MFADDAGLRSFLSDLVCEMEQVVPYAAVLLTAVRGLAAKSSSRLDQLDEKGPTSGAVFSVWTGECFEEAATHDLTRDGLARTARELIQRITVRRTGVEVAPGPAERADYRTPCRQDPDEVEESAKLSLCRDIRDRVQQMDSRIVEASCRYDEVRWSTLFVNRCRDVSQSIATVTLVPHIVFSDGASTRYDMLRFGGTGGFERAEVDEAALADMIGRIPGLLAAGRVPPGQYDVVVSPGTAGVIAHESFGHGVETDMFLKGRARAQEYVGKKIGSELVNLFDDPTYPGGPGSYFFDDEGFPASKTQIIQDGVLVGGLTDLNSAVRLGLPRTANGRRQERNKAYARMSNTYFGAGNDPLDDMIAGIDHGFYLGQAESGMEDPKGWGVQCILLWAREIKDGRLTDNYFTRVGLTGYVPDLLRSITMVGSDLTLAGGHCGKGYKEVVPVGMGGPHLKMKARLG